MLQIFLMVPLMEDGEEWFDFTKFSSFRDKTRFLCNLKKLDLTSMTFLFRLVLEAVWQELELSSSQEYGDNWKEIVKDRLNDGLGVEKSVLERFQSVLVR